MSHGHGPSRSLAASLLLNRCFFLQEQTASDFLSQSQLSIEPLISGMLGGCPISKAYLEAMLYGKYACFLGELKVRIRIRRDSEVEMKVQVQVVMWHVSHFFMSVWVWVGSDWASVWSVMRHVIWESMTQYGIRHTVCTSHAFVHCTLYTYLVCCLPLSLLKAGLVRKRIGSSKQNVVMPGTQPVDSNSRIWMPSAQWKA